MSRLQIILIVVFGFIGIIAVLIFAGILPGFKKQGQANGPVVTVWGVFPSRKFSSLLQSFNNENRSLFNLKYIQKDSLNYREEILNALASGVGPDIWIMPSDYILLDKDKVYIIPVKNISERVFRDNFIEAGEIFLNYDKNNSGDYFVNGVIGLPLAIDPLVLYWNRDIFSSSGISQPPRTWDEFLSMVQVLTKKDQAGNIVLSGTALGKFLNVQNAKEILLTFMMQGGDRIIDNKSFKVVLGEKTTNNIIAPAESALNFFNEFSNPNKSSYSWNEALPNSQTMFINGNLAMYFGFASELQIISEKNPHLNFDIAEIPQIKGTKKNLTFGRVYSIVLNKNTKNLQAAFYAATAMSGPYFQEQFSSLINLAPARRDILSRYSSLENPFWAVFYKSAISSSAWLDPNPSITDNIFKEMISSLSSGRSNINMAIITAKRQLEDLIK